MRMVHFVSACPGATDLITLRGKKLLENEVKLVCFCGLGKYMEELFSI